MTTHQYKTVSLSSVSVPAERSRSLDKDWAEALTAMFKDQGNKTAIEVRRSDEDGQYVLVAGLHRLEAAKLCGWEDLTVRLIEANSDQATAVYKLHEVMENLGRRELTILDRARHLHDFQEALYALHPELRHGGDRKSEAARENQNEIFSLRSDVSEKIGLSHRAIQMAVKLYKGLTKATRERVDGTWLADHQAGLMALAAHKAKMQANILDVLENPDNDVKSVADAILYLEQGRLLNAAERKIGGLRAALTKLDDATFDQLMDLHAERVKAWLERRGDSR
ncbi:MAG: hypothetical protein COA37_17710 [Hoeflea sp.]|uniref:ParB/RepB/Spo0J family partition protein n=1 Tax=Hoeflea sp. TaxID=1940281 RepID=UPI000C122140|nr:ParB N-terminal domain-containing protein [Hoeflea sp.]PHR19267.1 MAG: hypothetical protein COA37_17710 [Hoeflea sp.]